MTTFKHLSDCEKIVMKTVWDADDELSLREIMQKANDKYQKNWKPQTVSTFLTKLRKKGFLEYYRKGKVFLYKILVPLDEYKAHLCSEYIKFWNNDNAGEFLETLMRKRPLRLDEIEKIQAIINDCKCKEDEK